MAHIAAHRRHDRPAKRSARRGHGNTAIRIAYVAALAALTGTGAMTEAYANDAPRNAPSTVNAVTAAGPTDITGWLLPALGIACLVFHRRGGGRSPRRSDAVNRH